MQNKQAPPRTWIRLWLALSGLLVLYDAGYVLLRPRSMPGGDLFPIWKPYELYAKVDKLYGREAMLAGDGFNKAQAILNLAEVALHYTSLALLCSRSKVPLGNLVAFSSQLMTLWKTILYWLNDLCRPEGHRYSEGSTMQQFLLVYVLPNSFWLVVPSLVVATLGTDIAASLQGKQKRS